MLEAKSIYFGGEIINASECDYQSSRELGLTCPFCNSAVFIRSESVRKIKGNLQLVRPYFAHYSSGVSDNWDCEKRSHSKQGLEQIKKIKTEARNQRLKLYNTYLWNIIAEDKKISPRTLNKARSLFGEKWCEGQSIKVRHEWAASIKTIYLLIDAVTLKVVDYTPSGSRSLLPEIDGITLESQFSIQQQYFQTCDRRLHRAICYEVAEFLSTDTAGFVFEKIFKTCLLFALARLGDLSKVRQMKPQETVRLITGFLFGVHWVTQINKRLGSP